MNQQKKSGGKDGTKENTFALLGIQTGAATMETHMKIRQNINNQSAI